MEDIQTIKERLYDWWDLLLWRSSADCREMIRERLKEHDEAMRTGGKSPYFNEEQQ